MVSTIHGKDIRLVVNVEHVFKVLGPIITQVMSKYAVHLILLTARLYCPSIY